MSVTAEDIQSQMAKIKYLLHGNLDEDNIYRSGALSARIQPKTVTNMVDETRPVEGFKVFGTFVNGLADFERKILSPVIELKETNIQPITLYGECSFVFNNSTMERVAPSYITETDDVSPLTPWKDKKKGKKIYLQDTWSWEKRTIRIEKTPFMKRFTKQEYADKTGLDLESISDDFWLNFTFFSDIDADNFRNNFKVEVARIDAETLDIDCYLSQVGFDKDDFFTLQVGVEALFKEVL